MPKSRSRKHKTAKTRQQQWRPKVKQKATAWAKLRKFVPHFLWSWRTFVAALGIVGGVVGLYSVLVPRITVTSTQSLDPSDPFRTPFEIRNDGYFAINNVIPDCKVDNLVGPSVVMSNVTTQNLNYRATRIEPGAVATVRCAITPPPATQLGMTANILMGVSFRADYSPFTNQRQFRFTTVRARDGAFYWQQQPK
jgi:hypothetical protein